jgi:ribosomal protein S12 methylthiotransferase accessory factor
MFDDIVVRFYLESLMSYRITLEDAFKNYTLDQDKILSPQETIGRFRNKLKSVDLDILEKTERIDNGRLDIPVFFSQCGKDARDVIGTKKQMGKGGTPQQAEASAVMELAERFSFFSFCKNPKNFETGTSADIKENALPFEEIAKSVHDDSKELDISRKIYETLSMKWTWGFNLTRNKPVLIPFDWFFTINEFNGPSAGNCVEEAISQGICEVVERHVSSLISQEKISVPAIIPESATDPLVKEILGKYKANNIHVFLSDFSLGMGIPSIGVLAYDPSTFPEKSEIVWTAGTTPDPQKALSRALTETAQLAGDFNSGANYVASGLPKFRNLDAAKFITDTQNRVTMDTLPDISSPNIKIEVENSLAALQQKGFDVLVINTTHSLLDIPAFYTIIPGAHFRERATGTSVGMFSAKLITESNPPDKAYARLLEMDGLLPEKYYVHFYMGTCLLSMGQPEKALPLLESARRLNPPAQDMPSIYSYLGVAHKEMGSWEKALDVLKQGETYDKERTDIYNLMGFCHFKLKQHEQAIENFARVLDLNPGSAIDYANIGSNYREMGDKDKAIYFYEVALSIDPSIEFARENLGRLKHVK